jgi:NAD-dependent dihydropyrimidine dehydrogenase PreA subunit
MAKRWYPVIDHLTCIECGTCVEMCPHNVYDKVQVSSPVVRSPKDCIDHCHECGNRCPVGAITYVGDDTRWIPPNGNREVEEACCSCGCEAASEKKIVIEYLYLDLQSCDRCIGTDNVLDEVMITLTPTLQMAGYEVEYKKIMIESTELAKRYRFLSSPTIRVNGQDICQSVTENSCGCCSEISGTDVDCRVFEYNGESFEVPPKEMLVEAILRTVFSSHEEGCYCNSEYELPGNLKIFFEGKKNKSSCNCKGSCC